MSTRVLDRVEQWDERPFTDGYRGLQRLADEEFSGVVRADGLELFLTRGVAVAVRGGDIEEFGDASGAVHRAPSPALPLLAVMQERSDEVRDRFYTEQTPISTVDQTLSDGGFTGYIELSEDVLSGDYYLVYHAGNSMSVAFVGQSRRFVGGSQAFEAADDEVGIYRVRPVDVHPVDIPEPEPRESEQTGPDAPGNGDETPDATAAAGADGAETAPEPGDEETDVSGAERESDESEGQSDEHERVEQTEPPVETDAEPTATEADTGATATRTDPDVRTIPSVDPARTVSGGADNTAGESATDRSTTAEQSSHDGAADDSSGESDTPPVQQSASDRDAENEPGDHTTATATAEVEQLEQRLDDLEAECEALQERLDAVQAERDELRDQLAAIRDNHDER